MDPVTHPLPPVLTGGPCSPDVIIEFKPAWRAVPAGLGAAIDGLSNAMKSFMDKPMMTPANAAADIAQVSSKMGEVAGKSTGEGVGGAAGATSGALTAITTANVALTAAWTTASAVPGGQPAANQAYTLGIKAAMAAGASAVMGSMAGMFDIHACTTPAPIPPHGPGAVTKGAKDVFINNLPAARQGDKVMEAAGGANPIAMGCPTVNIGEDGGGGGGGGAGGAGGGGGAGGAGAGAGGAAGAAAGSDPLVDSARQVVSSTEWAYDANRPPYPSGTNKCNLFVFEMANRSGRPVEMFDRWSWSNLGYVDYPPLAGQWGDPSVTIPGWEVVTDPQPGDIAAIKQNYSDASGHVGIVSGPNSTISATNDQVVENDWGFRPGQQPVFRRYTGN